MLRKLLENSIRTGALVTVIAPVALRLCCSLKNGDSSRVLKMNQPSSELRSPAKNMQRHPHTANASPGNIDDMTRNTKDAIRAPMPAPPPPTRPDIAPRQFGEAHSGPMVWVERTTPPTKSP